MSKRRDGEVNRPKLRSREMEVFLTEKRRAVGAAEARHTNGEFALAFLTLLVAFITNATAWAKALAIAATIYGAGRQDFFPVTWIKAEEGRALAHEAVPPGQFR